MLGSNSNSGINVCTGLESTSNRGLGVFSPNVQKMTIAPESIIQIETGCLMTHPQMDKICLYSYSNTNKSNSVFLLRTKIQKCFETAVKAGFSIKFSGRDSLEKGLHQGAIDYK